MRDLSSPLAPTYGDPVKKKKKGGSKNKSCTPTNMKHCSAYDDNAQGPKGPKGGPKPKGKKGTNSRAPGGRKSLQQFCNTYPNHTACKKKKKNGGSKESEHWSKQRNKT